MVPSLAESGGSARSLLYTTAPAPGQHQRQHSRGDCPSMTRIVTRSPGHQVNGCTRSPGHQVSTRSAPGQHQVTRLPGHQVSTRSAPGHQATRSAPGHQVSTRSAPGHQATRTAPGHQVSTSSTAAPAAPGQRLHQVTRLPGHQHQQQQQHQQHQQQHRISSVNTGSAKLQAAAVTRTANR